MPTSVTTAVMHDGGVKSYNGLKIERFGRGSLLTDVEDGGNGLGAVHMPQQPRNTIRGGLT